MCLFAEVYLLRMSQNIHNRHDVISISEASNEMSPSGIILAFSSVSWRLSYPNSL